MDLCAVIHLADAHLADAHLADAHLADAHLADAHLLTSPCSVRLDAEFGSDQNLRRAVLVCWSSFGGSSLLSLCALLLSLSALNLLFLLRLSDSVTSSQLTSSNVFAFPLNESPEAVLS